METVNLGLGSNLGNKELNLSAAIGFFKRNKAVDVVKISSVYRTEPWGEKDQAEFLNLVFQIKTSMVPEDLLKFCNEVENKCGRMKSIKWGPRTVDVDILTYGDMILSLKDITIPHAFLTERRFVLVPFAEICPDCVIPGKNVTVKQALLSCPDRGRVVFYKKEINVK